MAELDPRARGAALTRAAGVLCWVAFLVSGCGGGSPSAPTPAVTDVTASPAPGQPAPRFPIPSGAPAVFVGAGDIALCGPDLANAEATSRLLDAIDGTVFTVGDNTQVSGTAQEFQDCYQPTWGRHRARTRPSPGNHDYGTAGAGPYFNYFGANAGPPGLGFYSYDLGAWHVVSLNGNVATGPGSAQNAWLRADLEANGRPCTLAYWHQPLFSSSVNGNNPHARDLWQVLYEHSVELVINGHDHLYERFAPQDPQGRFDALRGIRQFTVGTGGCYLYGTGTLQANSEVQGSAHGVLRLTLAPEGYDWQFVAVPGASFSDAGSGVCR